MNEKKQYLIDEDTLRELLYSSHKLAILERDGVDNWPWYMEGREEYLTDCLGELPWNQGKTYEELNEIVEEEGYYIEDLVDDQIDAFWIPIPSGSDGYSVAGYCDAEHVDKEEV